MIASDWLHSQRFTPALILLLGRLFFKANLLNLFYFLAEFVRDTPPQQQVPPAGAPVCDHCGRHIL
jgi:hypothetical protein